MTMVLRIDSKSPIHHVREGRLGVAEVRSLDRIPSARQGRALLSTTTNIKGASPRPQLSTPPHSILRVARACSCQSPPSCRMYVERFDVSFLSSLSGSPSTVALVCQSSPNALFFFSSSFSRRLFRSAGVEHPRMRNRPPHSVVPLLRRGSVHAHFSMQLLL